MFNDLLKIEQIQKLIASGATHELIKDVLELNNEVDAVLAAHEYQKDLLNTQQTSEYLTKSLKGKVKGIFDTQKVNRLRKDGLLNAVNATPTKREGYRYHILEVQRFVEEQLISKEELLEKQKATLQKLHDSQKDVASLKRKIKALEEKVKKQKEESNS